MQKISLKRLIRIVFNIITISSFSNNRKFINKLIEVLNEKVEEKLSI